MKILVSDLQPLDVIRRAGYGQVNDRRATESSWSRRLGSGLYPRFHIYINGNEINLHLDQKQVSYEGSNAHSGEYDGSAVEAEADRISEIITKLTDERFSGPKTITATEKTGFFSRFFG